MGDADDSYDFDEPRRASSSELRDGDDLVMGNRFKGGIEPGAMPFLHRYLGNPVLSFIGRLFFRIAGRRLPLRPARLPPRPRCCELGLQHDRHGVRQRDGRQGVAGRAADRRGADDAARRTAASRPPHLRTWRDGWRHLRFLLIYSPRWLFLYPVSCCSGRRPGRDRGPVSGQLKVGNSTGHTFVACCMLVLISMPGRHPSARSRAGYTTKFVACCRRRRATQRSQGTRRRSRRTCHLPGCPGRPDLVAVAVDRGRDSGRSPTIAFVRVSPSASPALPRPSEYGWQVCPGKPHGDQPEAVKSLDRYLRDARIAHARQWIPEGHCARRRVGVPGT